MNIKLSSTMKWVLGGFGIFVLLFLCVAPLMARMVFMRVGGGFDTEDFRARRGAFAQERQEMSRAERDSNEQSQNEETIRDRRSSRGHHFKHHGRHGFGRGFSPVGAIFGFFGGLVRLAGLGMLALAAVIWLKPQMDRRQTSRKRDHQDTQADDDDDDDSDNNTGQWV